MQLGMIGLGRMGANIVRRLTRAGHLRGLRSRPAPGEALAKDGAVGRDLARTWSPSCRPARALGHAARGRRDRIRRSRR